MASSSSDKKTQNRKKTPILMLNDLLRAQELTHQLNEKINGSTEVKDLIDQILNTFSRVISDLKTPEESASVESSEVSNGKRKFTDETDQRMNCRKRPRSAYTRKVISETIEDGQAWRKYGQKKILNSEHPRSYFRCTHKFDQGCKATKLVQRSQEDPNLHTITYTGHHTCKDQSMIFPHQIVSTSTLDDNSCIISFGSNTNTNTYTNVNKTNQEGLTSPQSYQSMEEEVLSNLTTATDTDPTVAQISKQLYDQIEELSIHFDPFELDPFLNLDDFELGLI